MSKLLQNENLSHLFVLVDEITGEHFQLSAADVYELESGHFVFNIYLKRYMDADVLVGTVVAEWYGKKLYNAINKVAPALHYNIERALGM